jgi:hypothetical protein
MRRFRGLALTVAALVAVGCGGDGDGGGNGPENQAPTANFADPTCTELSCTFTDASTDPDGNTTIASRAWTFESGTPATSDQPTQAVSFPASGTYTVTLVVTDDQGASDDFSREVTVTSTAPPGNQNPVASFTVQCTALNCSFTDTSTDPDGTNTIVSRLWDFGEPSSGTNNTSDDPNPAHTYTATEVTEFTVTLTVTDDQGATSTTSQTFNVTPAAGLECDNGGTLASCTLNLATKSTLTITLTSRDCELGGNRFRIISPVVRTVFFNGCSVPVGTVYTITGPNPDGSFDAGTQIQAEFTQGAGSPEDPPRAPPQIRLDGTGPTWTINIDDGGDALNPPDFDDIVLTAQATTVP